jgi:hypothetical protein
MNTRLALPFLALCAAPLTAQLQEVAIPRLAGQFEGNDIAAQYPFGRTGFRTQFLIDSAAVAASGGLISGIEFRPDSSNSIGSAAVTIPNVTIQISTTSFDPSSMAVDFATNVTGTPVTVFQGSVSFPAHTSNNTDPAPWTRIQFQTPFGFATGNGDLLVDISAADTNSVTTGFSADSWLPGGTVTGYGTPGALSQPDAVRLTVSANGTNGRFSGLVPAGQFTILAQSQFSPWTGALLLGLDRAAQPIDLTGIGAPGNTLEIDPISSFPFTLTPFGFGYRATWPIAIPIDPAVAGKSLHMQPAIVDLPANALGLVLGSAVQVVVGDPLPHAMRQLNARDYQAAVGTYQYSGAILGGAVMRLVGNFQ